MSMLSNRASVLNRSPGKILRDYLLRYTGCLLGVKLQAFSEYEACYGNPAWRTCVASELYLRRVCGEEVPDDWFEALRAVSPFENSIRLVDIWDKQAACAMFPLAALNEIQNAEKQEPGVGYVWIVKGLAHRDDIDGVEEIPDGYGVCTVTSSGNWSGKSWQLAGRLALRALEAQQDIASLVKDWIITGQTSGQRVDSVALGNKLDLKVNRRTWMIPRDSVRQVSPDLPRTLRIRSAHDLITAWNSITGQGTKSEVPVEWPKAFDELHMLVGGNIKAQVASALLSGGCKKVVLWCSEDEKNSGQPARQIIEVLRSEQLIKVLQSVDARFDIEDPKVLPSADIAGAEDKLRNYFRGLTNSSILFNVTSGTRLMSYAVQSVALLYPNIELVYREMGCEVHHEFVHLRYTEFPPYSGKMTKKDEVEHLPAEINWAFLYDRMTYNGLDDFEKKLFMTKEEYAACQQSSH